jgi:hypothetical protein
VYVLIASSQTVHPSPWFLPLFVSLFGCPFINVDLVGMVLRRILDLTTWLLQCLFLTNLLWGSLNLGIWLGKGGGGGGVFFKKRWVFYLHSCVSFESCVRPVSQ